MFKEQHFTSEVVLWGLSWHLAFPISPRDLASVLSDRGVAVDHTPVFHWVQVYAARSECKRPASLPTRLFLYPTVAAVLDRFCAVSSKISPGTRHTP